MVSLVADNLDAIRGLCLKYGVTHLDLFGSAATGAFDAASSDIDLLYDLDTSAPNAADRFFDFKDALEHLLGRPVDLVYLPQLTNKYLIDQINKERTPLYAAA